MATQVPVTFAPIGGFPSSADIAPTSAFIAVYACLVPLCIYRLSAPKSRNVVQLPIAAAVVERILNLAVRLLQARGKWPWTSATLLEYQQLTLEWGWIALAHSMVAFWRSVAVNATRPDLEKGEREDEKSTRRLVKKVTYAFDGAYWVAQLLGVGAAISWRISLHDGLTQSLKMQVDGLRYSAICLAIALVTASIGGIIWTRSYMHGIDKRACSCLVLLYLSLLVVPIYRLSQYSWLSTTNPSKALFYTFHLAPEFLVTATLISSNTRQLFQTGLWGDYYFSWRNGWTTPTAVLRKRRQRLRLVSEERRSWRWSGHRTSMTGLRESRIEENDDAEILIPKDSLGRPALEEVRQVKRLPSATLRSPRFASFSHRHQTTSTPENAPPMRERRWQSLDRPSSYAPPLSRVPSPPTTALVRDDHGHGSFCYGGSMLG